MSVCLASNARPSSHSLPLTLKPVAKWLIRQLALEHRRGRWDRVHTLSQQADQRALRYWVFDSGDSAVGKELLKVVDDSALAPLQLDLIRHWYDLPDGLAGACAPFLAKRNPEAFADLAWHLVRRGGFAGHEERLAGVCRALGCMNGPFLAVAETLIARMKSPTDVGCLVWCGGVQVAARWGTPSLPDVLAAALTGISDPHDAMAELILADLYQVFAGEMPYMDIAREWMHERPVTTLSELSVFLSPEAPVDELCRILRDRPADPPPTQLLSLLPGIGPHPELSLLCHQLVRRLPAALSPPVQRALTAFVVASVCARYTSTTWSSAVYSTSELLRFAALNVKRLPFQTDVLDAIAARTSPDDITSLLGSLAIHRWSRGGQRIIRILSTFPPPMWLPDLVACLDARCDDEVADAAWQLLASLESAAFFPLMERVSAGASLPMDRVVSLLDCMGDHERATGLVQLWRTTQGDSLARRQWLTAAACCPLPELTAFLSSLGHHGDPEIAWTTQQQRTLMQALEGRGLRFDALRGSGHPAIPHATSRRESPRGNPLPRKAALPS